MTRLLILEHAIRLAYLARWGCEPGVVWLRCKAIEQLKAEGATK
jgi:hypothetical protein